MASNASTQLNRDDLFSLEQYARERARLRAEVIEHKRLRNVAVGPNCTWCFEDRKTIQYQVQEMLRAERIFESEAIQDELNAYNPLIPDGHNWKVTMLIEFPDPAERQSALMEMKGIEARCWVRVGDLQAIFAIADEDLPRENAEKTSAVHFLRFELPPAAIADLQAGAPLGMGVDHPRYCHSVNPVSEPTRTSLSQDLLAH
jgi:Protein of unknown function (DUF3501)